VHAARTDGPIAELRGIGKSYGTPRNPLPVLSDVDLDISSGEYLAIIGPSGSGKSTLLNILGCLDVPTWGSYRIEGEDVARFDDVRLSKVRNTRIGFVFQSFHLVSHLTVLENVELPMFYAHRPRADRRRRCHELLERVGLGARLHHKPPELSGGERQRAAIARALANDPALILADEPTGTLDAETAAAVLDLLDTLVRESGRTVIMVTHSREVVGVADRIFAAERGQLVEQTAPISGAAR